MSTMEERDSFAVSRDDAVADHILVTADRWARLKIARTTAASRADLSQVDTDDGGLWAIVHRSPSGRDSYVEASLPVETRDRRDSTLERATHVVKALFETYAEAWSEETRYASSVEQIVLNLNYQKIIGLGPQAVPLIMGRLRHTVGHWFWALTAIVGEDKGVGTTTLEEARQRWLAWFDAEYIGE